MERGLETCAWPRARHQRRAAPGEPGGADRRWRARGRTSTPGRAAWASSDGGAGVRTRGARHIFCLPLTARGNDIGTVTLHARAEDDLRRARRSSASSCWPTSSRSPCRTRATTARSSSRPSATRSPASTTAASSSRRSRRRSARRERYGSPVSLVIFDIDDFKSDQRHASATPWATTRFARVTEIARGADPPDRQLRPARRRGVRPAAARDPAARRAAGGRPPPRRRGPAGGDARPARDAQRRAGVVPAGRRYLRGARAARRRRAVLGQAQRQEHLRGGQRGDPAEGGGDEVRGQPVAPLRAGVDDRRRAAAHARPLRERGRLRRRAGPGARPERGARGEAAPGGVLPRHRQDRRVALDLAKPGALDDAEWERDPHPPRRSGRTMLVHAGLPDEAGWVGQHHERVDGGGYPEGLQGRGDRRGGAHHLRGRRLRGDDLGPPLPQGHGGRRRRGGAARLRRLAVRPADGRGHGRAAGARPLTVLALRA